MGRIRNPRQVFLVKVRTGLRTHEEYLVSVEDFRSAGIPDKPVVESGGGFRLDVRLLAGPRSVLDRWAWTGGSVLRMTPVRGGDLPLYVGMEWKSPLFAKMLKGLVHIA